MSNEFTVIRAGSIHAPALTKLWLQCFPEDTTLFVDAVLQCVFAGHGISLCMPAEDSPVAALYLMEAAAICPDGVSYPVRYLYAGGVDPAFRRRGCYGRLLDEAARLVEEMGEQGIYLLPADADLMGYYLARGYRTGIRLGCSESERRGIQWLPCAPVAALFAATQSGCDAVPGDVSPVWLATGGTDLPTRMARYGGYTCLIGN